MANPLNDITRALGSLAVLPDIGRQISRMVKDVRLMREAVEDLPKQIAVLNDRVDALHVDMKRMVDDVSELKVLTTEIQGVRTDLQRLPFVGRSVRKADKADKRGELPPAGEDELPAA